jgi:hypothetical protein
MLWAGLLALPLVVVSSTPVSAQGCATGGCPPFAGLMPSHPAWGGPFSGSPIHCGAFCMRLWGAAHQHGPLFNYGPYSGYYPFEPYGPWTSDLRYNPAVSCKRCGFGNCGGRCGGGLGGLFNRDRCDSGCGRSYALATFKNVFARLKCGSRNCDSSQTCAATTCGPTGCPTAPAGGCINER